MWLTGAVVTVSLPAEPRVQNMFARAGTGSWALATSTDRALILAQTLEKHHDAVQCANITKVNRK